MKNTYILFLIAFAISSSLSMWIACDPSIPCRAVGDCPSGYACDIYQKACIQCEKDSPGCVP